MVVDRETRRVVCVGQGKGGDHDFSLYKKTIGRRIHGGISVLADSGYQGLERLHANSRIPRKKSKSRPLSAAEKASNRRLSRERILVEHINAVIKVFKIMSYPYRNRRRRHLLRMSLICGIINYETK